MNQALSLMGIGNWCNVTTRTELPAMPTDEFLCLVRKRREEMFKAHGELMMKAFYEAGPVVPETPRAPWHVRLTRRVLYPFRFVFWRVYDAFGVLLHGLPEPEYD